MENYTIQTLNQSELDKLILFNIRMFPERGAALVRKCINFWTSRSEDAFESIVTIKVNDDIVGQDFLSANSYYFEDAKNSGYFGFDLIVDEEYRKSGCGIDIHLFVKKHYPMLFGTGLNPNSFAMCQKIGCRQNGTMRKYLGVYNPFCLPFSVCRSTEKFPVTIMFDNTCFKLLTKEELPDFNEPFNNNLLEFGREKDYLKWRFFNELHHYYLYYNEKDHSYFVVRLMRKKHIKVLLLVDYRCKLSTLTEFNNIIKAVKRLMKKTHLSFLICGSSNRFVDQICEKHRMHSIGTPRLMIGPKFLKEYEDKINNREFSLITLADSDGEVFL